MTSEAGATAPVVSPLILALGGLAAMAAAHGIGRFVYTPILPVMLDETGLGTAEAGLIASANFVGYLVGALLAALPGLPGTPRTWLLGSLLASAVTTAAMALPSDLAVFLGLRFLGGVASAFVLVYASALILVRLTAAGRSGLSSLLFGGVGVGIALSAVLVAFAREAGADWRDLWLISGGAAALALALVPWTVPDDEPVTAQPVDLGNAANRSGHSGGFVSLVIAYGLFGFGYIITATFLVEIVRTTPATAPLEPLVWLAVGIAGTPSVAIWAWIGKRIGLMRAYSIACLVETIGILASVLWIGPIGALAAAMLIGGTFMALPALGLMAARHMVTGDPRRIMALMTAAFGVGQVIGPAFAGIVHDQVGSFVAPSLAAAAALLLAAALTARGDTMRRRTT